MKEQAGKDALGEAAKELKVSNPGGKSLGAFFADFELEPDHGRLLLQWRERNSDLVFGASQAADGMVRVMALVALLQQPEKDLPAVLILVLFPKLLARPLRALHGRGHGGIAARITETLEKLVAGLGVMRSRKQLAQTIALSFLMWLVIDVSILLGIRAFGLPLRFTDMFLLVVPLGMGIVMPTPGGVGPYEYLCQVSLAGFWGVAQASAGAAAITLHAITLLPTIALGLLFMWKAGVRPAEVGKMAHVEEGGAP